MVLGSAKAPSTSGIIEVDDISGGNTLVSIHLEHLHPPQRLDRDFGHYVVWFKGGAGPAIRAGALRYDPDNRTGDLSETSTLKEFTVLVTAERQENAAQPGDYVIASHKILTD